MKKIALLALLLIGCGPLKERYRSVTWTQLSSFSCPPKSAVRLPAEVQALDGLPLQLTGYMVPLEVQGSRVQSFLLVRDQMLCCFGRMPALNEWVFVEFPPGAGQELQVDRLLQVSGRFRAREERDRGVTTSLYRMEVEKVKVLSPAARP